MFIKVLIENTVEKERPELKPQHGISLYLETLGKKMLFDVGQNHLFLENARKLAVPVEAVDGVIISHGHYDHGGGLEPFFRKNSRGMVFLNKNCFTPLYARRTTGELKYIGLNVEMVSSHPGRVGVISETYGSIAPGISLLANTHYNGFRPSGGIFLKKNNDRYEADDFKHELVLVVSEPDGDVVFTGCSHSGVTNMLRSYRAYFPRRTLKALVGGFHLADPSSGRMIESEKKIRELAEDIRSFRPRRVFTGHCTGDEAFQVLSQELGAVIHRFRTGSQFSI